jgi:hypothetical protein
VLTRARAGTLNLTALAVENHVVNRKAEALESTPSRYRPLIVSYRSCDDAATLIRYLCGAAVPVGCALTPAQ